MMLTKKDDQYGDQEIEQRIDKLVRAALNTRPKPLKVDGTERCTGTIEEMAETHCAWASRKLQHEFIARHSRLNGHQPP
jgi:hypothetical protein